MTTTSPERGALAAALAAFQSEAPSVPKDKTANVPTKSGGSYSYSYADLASVAEKAYPLLSKHGLAFTCTPRHVDAGHYELAGILMHTSGESVEGSLPLFGNSLQELGSSITYARRYLLGSMTGIVTDVDEDGAASAGSSRTRRQPNRPAREEQPVEPPTAEQELNSAKTRVMAAAGNLRPDLAKDELVQFVLAGIEARGLDGTSVADLTRLAEEWEQAA